METSEDMGIVDATGDSSSSMSDMAEGSDQGRSRLMLESRLESLLEVTVVDAVTGEGLRLVSSDEEVASPKGLMIQTRKPGTTTISLETQDGTELDSAEIEVFFEIEEVEVGLGFACARSSTGRTFCWGINDEGQLTRDFFSNEPELPEVHWDPNWREVGQKFSEIELGRQNACGIDYETGELYCWGKGDENLAALDNSPPVVTPRRIEIPAPVEQVSVAWSHACAIDAESKLFCWGSNDDGEIGTGEVGGLFQPTEVVGNTFSAVSVADDHSCAVSTEGRLYCWGDATDGQLGLGEDAQNPEIGGTLAHPTPSAVMLEEVQQVAAGHEHTCALWSDLSGATVSCWGRDTDGVVGDGPAETGQIVYAPVELQIALSAPVEIKTEHDHTCILRQDETMLCWGIGNNGRLGNGDGSEASPTPVVFEPDTRVKAFGVGYYHTCAVALAATDSTGVILTDQVYCWGRDDFGLLGPDYPDPVDGEEDRRTPYALQMPWAYWWDQAP